MEIFSMVIKEEGCHYFVSSNIFVGQASEVIKKDYS